MTETSELMTALREFRSEMIEDYARFSEAFKKQETDPPGALTELASAMALGNIPAQPGDAKRVLDSWDAVVTELQETRATLMACFMFVHKTLYWLDRRGILHSHTDEGGLKDGS